MGGQHAFSEPSGPTGTHNGHSSDDHQPIEVGARASSDASDHAACLRLRCDDLIHRPQPRHQSPEGRALCRQGASAWRFGGVAGFAEVGPSGANSSGGAGLGAGLPEAEGSGLRGGVVDDEVAGAARPAALRRSQPSESVEVSSGDGVEDSCAAGDPSPQNIVLP